MEFSEDMLITNTSFLNEPGRVLPDLNDTTIFDEAMEHEIPEENAGSKSQSIITFMRSLFSVSPTDLSSVNFVGLTAIIINKGIQYFTPDEIEKLTTALKPHVGLYDGGHPWIDLEAAYLLDIKRDLLYKHSYSHPLPSVPFCPRMVVQLQNGRYIPMQHILHSLAIFQFDPELECYPLIYIDPVPPEFVKKIKRNDVIRGANFHNMYLASKFPLLAIQFPAFIDQLWSFMFRQKFSAIAGMELYNEFFYYYSKKLGTGSIPPLNHIPSAIYSRIAKKFQS